MARTIKPQLRVHQSGDCIPEFIDQYRWDPYNPDHDLAFDHFKGTLRHSDVVLHVGCGDGDILGRTAPHARRVDGLELNPDAAATARALGYTVYSTIEELPSIPVYDVVVGSQMIGYCRAVASTLERIHASMKPDAVLLLKYPRNEWSPDHLNTMDAHVNDGLRRLIVKKIRNVLHQAHYEAS